MRQAVDDDIEVQLTYTSTRRTQIKCNECGRVFDLTDDEQAGEWFYGHDCEEA